MPDKAEISHQFGSLGIPVNEDVLDLCEAICSRYQLSEENFVEAWVAWSFNHLDGQSPTEERLTEWESKELSKNKMYTPKVNDKIKTASKGQNQNLIFSPASFSPDVYSPSMKYNSRTNTGQSVTSYGSVSKWSSQHKSNVEVKEYIPLNIEWKYSHNTLRDLSLLMLDACEELADFILSKNQLQASTPLSSNVLETSVFVGRVGAFDKTKSPLKIPLLGLFESSGLTVELDLNDAADYALFPGQVIAVEGRILSNKLLASNILSSGILPLPPQPTIKDAVQIVVAAGPFTLSDTLSYEPLHDLVKFVKEKQPNLLFLIGPLIDANHPKISDGNIAESFHDYYQRMITNLVDSLKETNTKLIVIAGNREAASIPVYPTPPLCAGVSLRNVKFYQDPVLLSVSGIVIGLTATDTVFHIGKYEISDCKSNRLARLGGHMLHQQTFYPLYPSEPDVGIDIPLWHKCARLPVTPHILVAPSNLNSFVKDVDGCLIVNPERLTKGMVGGTFSCIEARPIIDGEDWSTSTHISAKIVKI
uniref:DNA polymerase alpha subunit B n=1 Tax=Rhodnius prolixus TaxID=13249 RepID=T1I548_RHOPR